MERVARKAPKTGVKAMLEALPESGTVTVACKMPNGVQLRVFRMVEQAELVMGGGTRMTQRAEPIGNPVILKGNAIPFGVTPEHKIIGGYALTEDVDAQFFRKWLEQNADSALVQNKLVFAWEKVSTVEGQAREQALLRSGLEPEDPENPRVKRVTKANTKMEMA